MDGDRPLTDAALDREILAALAVNPSPEFLARVRQRVAAEPTAVSLGSSRRAAFAAAAVAVAIAVWSWPDGDPAPLPVALSEVAPTEPPPAVIAAPAPRAAEAAPGTSAPVVERAAAARTGLRGETPIAAADVWEERFSVVILAENERKALQWFGAATSIPPPRPAEITVSAERAADDRPALPLPFFEPLGMREPEFQRVSLE